MQSTILKGTSLKTPVQQINYVIAEIVLNGVDIDTHLEIVEALEQEFSTKFLKEHAQYIAGAVSLALEIGC